MQADKFLILWIAIFVLYWDHEHYKIRLIYIYIMKVGHLGSDVCKVERNTMPNMQAPLDYTFCCYLEREQSAWECNRRFGEDMPGNLLMNIYEGGRCLLLKQSDRFLQRRWINMRFLQEAGDWWKTVCKYTLGWINTQIWVVGSPH